MRTLVLLSALCALFSCRPTPFQIKPIPKGSPYQVDKSDNEPWALNEEQISRIEQEYKKASSPTLGIIHAYYRLPKTQIVGAATIIKDYQFPDYMEKIEIKEQEKPFSIMPLSGEDALAFNGALNALLDMGITIKEISMADALLIAEAEELAVNKKDNWFLSRYLPPSVDMLMSLYKTRAQNQDVMVGRVLNKDGRLLAFKVMEGADSPRELKKLIISLLAEAIARING